MPCRARTEAPVAEPATGGQARWRVLGGWRASCWSLDEGACWPSRPRHKGGRQWEGRRDRVAGADRRGSSRGQGRGRWGAPYTHNTHCTLKLSLVSGIYVYNGKLSGLVVVIGELLELGWRNPPEQLVGAEAAGGLTAKLECPDGTRYYFDSESNM